MSIRQVVNESDTFSGRAFDFVALFLIVFSIITLTIDTLPDLPSFVSDVLDISEIVITVLFTIEYLVRVAAAPKKIGYILSFYGIVDLIAILPFYIALGVDLRAVRAFRLFRIIRILKLTRYSRAMERFAKALSYAKEEVVIFFMAPVRNDNNPVSSLSLECTTLSMMRSRTRFDQYSTACRRSGLLPR